MRVEAAQRHQEHLALQAQRVARRNRARHHLQLQQHRNRSGWRAAAWLDGDRGHAVMCETRAPRGWWPLLLTHDYRFGEKCRFT